MSEPFENVSPRVVDLVIELTDGHLPPAGREELRSLLAANESDLRWYCQWMELHAMLHLDLADDHLALATPRLVRQRTRGLPPETAIAPQKSGRRPHWAAWAAVAASAAIIASLWPADESPLQPSSENSHAAVSREFGEAGDAARSEFQRLDSRAIAVVSRVADAVWSTRARLGQGTRVLPGRFVLDSGVVQLEFFNGANLVVEGPADIELLSTTSVYCRRGKLRARVPVQAHGFTIETPTHRAIDLGTEFAVDVGGADKTEVHVLDGEVRLQDKARASAENAERLLALGDAFRGAAEGVGEPIKADAARFIDAERLIQLSEEDAKQRYADWQGASQKLARDPRVVTYFTFENHERSERLVRPDGPLEGEPEFGAIVGCRWTEGRWPLKRGLEFKGVDDRVKVFIPGEFDSVSMACWVRIDGFDRFLSSLLMTEGHDVGELHWQFTDTGKLMLGVKADNEWSQDYFSDIVLRPADIGRWVHLACVYDQKVGRISHYLDGERVSTEAPRKNVKIRFGASEIGNWIPEVYRAHRVRALNGRMDEFVLFGTGLSDEAIRRLYESGKPSS